MKKLLLCAVALVMGVSAMAANDPKWQDPNFFEENRLPMRSTFIVTPTAENAVAEHDFRQSPLYRSIGGVWKFYWTENATDPQPVEFWSPKFDDSAWGKMPVPGLLNMGKLIPVSFFEVLPNDWFNIKNEFLLRFMALISPGTS